MRAIVFTRYGSPDVLELREIARPTPRADQVLVRVHAVSINDWDWAALHGFPFVNRLMFGLFRPSKQVLGSDIAGRVVEIGSSVRQLRPGDEVFGDLSGDWGGFAEYVCARESALALKAPRMTFEQAAAIPQAAMLAVQSLRDAAQIQPGQSLLINGAGGGVGTFAIQIAKLHGVEVTAVDSRDKLEMLSGMGADHVIDYAREDATRRGQRYDVILDVKTKRSVLEWIRALSPDGAYVTVGGSMARLFQTMLLGPWVAMTTKKKVRVVILKVNRDLAYMRQLFEAGKVVPVIDGPYKLSEVPRAMRLFGEGRHKGKVVIAVEQ
ncbi:MAG: NAD(P)-dependent alcohol dehydrogenase [Candidatus Eiseniibacteriota bacterium]